LAGRTVRCKTCRETFVVRGAEPVPTKPISKASQQVETEAKDDAVDNTPARAKSRRGASTEDRQRRPKRKRPKGSALPKDVRNAVRSLVAIGALETFVLLLLLIPMLIRGDKPSLPEGPIVLAILSILIVGIAAAAFISAILIRRRKQGGWWLAWPVVVVLAPGFPIGTAMAGILIRLLLSKDMRNYLAQEERVEPSEETDADFDDNEEYDDDDTEETPRPRKKRAANRSVAAWIVGGVLVGVVLAAALGFGVWHVVSGRKAENRPGMNVAVPRSDTANAENRSGKRLAVPQSGTPNVVGTAQPSPPSVPRHIIKSPAVAVPFDSQQGTVEQILLSDSSTHRVGLCTMVFDAGQLKRVFDLYDNQNLKLLTRTEMTNVKSVTRVSMSPDTTHLAAMEIVSNAGKTESAVTIWSLADGKTLKAGWKPRISDGPGGNLEWIALVDAQRLLMICMNGQIALQDLQGRLVYSFKHLGPIIGPSCDAFSNLPQNFAISGNRKVLCLFNGKGFDVIDTDSGKVKAKTAEVVGARNLIKGTALDHEGNRLAVYFNDVALGASGESVVVWDLATNQKSASIPISVKKQNQPSAQGFHGSALTWWDANHLVVWSIGKYGLVLDLGKAQIVAEMLPPLIGRLGYADSEQRLWYQVMVPGATGKGYLCAVDFPKDGLEPRVPLDDKGFYTRWLLTPEGIEIEPVEKKSGFPRLSPAK
jgi:hypothetical protein